MTEQEKISNHVPGLPTHLPSYETALAFYEHITRPGLRMFPKSMRLTAFLHVALASVVLGNETIEVKHFQETMMTKFANKITEQERQTLIELIDTHIFETNVQGAE